MSRIDPIFIKYLTHATSKYPTKLVNGDILFFYLSGENKVIVGFSRIEEICMELPTYVKNEYLNRIQMNESELNNYIKDREVKPLLILKLNKIIELTPPISINFPITMTGKYVYETDMKSLINLKI